MLDKVPHRKNHWSYKMGIESIVIGNMLNKAERRIVKVRGEDATVTEFRVMADVYKRDANDQLVQDDQKSEPVQVAVWNARLGEEIARLFKPGCRLIIQGTQTIQTWEKDGRDQYQVQVNASNVGLIPYRIEHIEYRQKREAAPAAAAPAAASAEAPAQAPAQAPAPAAAPAAALDQQPA
jgi:single-stranded DNA-binding protein